MSIDIAPHPVVELGVIIVAAGRGERLGADLPKAFVELGGRTLLEHTIRTVSTLPHRGQLVVVVPDGYASLALDIADEAIPEHASWQVSIVPGGRERHESVRFGLGALSETIDTVLVHDAARPLTPATVFERVLDTVHRTGDAVIPAISVADTLKRVDAAGIVLATVDRGALVAVQTPQGFTREGLAAAHETAMAQSPTAQTDPLPTDDAEVVQRFGGTVRTVPGDPLAHKVTTPADLALLTGAFNGQGVE